jgi:Cytochrome c7 and related cytochrome c/Class III cytochrome C family
LLALALHGEVAFSHKRHARLRLDCAYCHTTAKTGERASYPDAATCKLCHPQMASLPQAGKIVPARSMYMLADFVFFSHARHHAANVPCQTCHGKVWEQDAIVQAMPMTMKACLSCHKANHAKTGCTTCHELNQ